MAHIKIYWRRGMGAGIFAMISYGIVLWAFTFAPIAYVSALREVSVLFAALIGVIFLKEPFRLNRIIAACFICAGVGILTLI